jgi:hypothetical protein
MRSAGRVEVKNCPAFASGIVESNPISEFGHEKQAVTFIFRIVEANIHAAVVDHPEAATLIACGIVKDDACGRTTSRLRLSFNNWVRQWSAQDKPNDAARINDGQCVGPNVFLWCLNALPPGKEKRSEQYESSGEKTALFPFQSLGTLLQTLD